MKILKNNKNYKCIVDDEDYERYKDYNWSVNDYYNKGPYFVRIKQINNKKESIRLHRLIMNAKKGEEVDHIDGNTLDNRKCNLRICTPKENSRNRKRQKNNTTGYVGVLFVNRKYLIRQFRARIKVDGKIKHLGYFKTREEAALAYNIAAVIYFGEFARLNIINGQE